MALETAHRFDYEPTELGRVQRIHVLSSLLGPSANVSTAALAALASHLVAMRVTRGTALALAGRPSGRVFIVEQGELTTTRGIAPLARFAPHSAVGLLTALARDPNGTAVEAARNAVVLALEVEDLLEVIEDHSDLAHAVLRGIAQQGVDVRASQRDDGGFKGILLTGVEPPLQALHLVERLLYLRHTFPLANSHLDALAEIARASDEVHLPAATPLWAIGDRADHMLVVVSGIVHCRTAIGAEFRFGPRDVVGSLDMVAEAPRWFDATIEQDVVALRLQRDVVADLWEDHSELTLDFLHLFATGLLAVNEQRAGDRSLVLRNAWG